MAISMARAKALCTANELSLVKASTRTELGQLSAARLRQKIARARQLRDKWRDQATSQRRASQSRQGGRGAEGNARSAEKAELFGEVLDRFTTQLDKVETTGGGPKGPRKPPTRKARTAQHRATRAAKRQVLEEQRQELTASAPAVSQQPSPSSPASGKAAKTADAKPAPKRPQKRRSASAKDAAAAPLKAGRQAQGLKVTGKSQLEARTAAKQRRVKTSGQVRVQKHLSATNKRRQAKRDSR